MSSDYGTKEGWKFFGVFVAFGLIVVFIFSGFDIPTLGAFVFLLIGVLGSVFIPWWLVNDVLKLNVDEAPAKIIWWVLFLTGALFTILYAKSEVPEVF